MYEAVCLLIPSKFPPDVPLVPAVPVTPEVPEVPDISPLNDTVIKIVSPLFGGVDDTDTLSIVYS